MYYTLNKNILCKKINLPQRTRKQQRYYILILFYKHSKFLIRETVRTFFFSMNLLGEPNKVWTSSTTRYLCNLFTWFIYHLIIDIFSSDIVYNFSLSP